MKLSLLKKIYIVASLFVFTPCVTPFASGTTFNVQNAFTLHHESPIFSGLSKSSFSVFSTVFDTYLDTLYWNQTQHSTTSIRTGISENHLATGASFFLKNVYYALSFNAEITNYKDWPQNRTNLEVQGFVGLPKDWAIKVRYYDYCYSQGKGVVLPSAELGKTWHSDKDYRLKTSIDAALALVYNWSNIIDTYQPRATFRADYSKDEENGFGISYTFMNTIPSLNDKAITTDDEDIPLYHRFEFWAGRTFQLGSKLRAGAKIDAWCAFNSWYAKFNPNTNEDFALYNMNPINGNFDAHIQFPVSLLFSLADGRLLLNMTLMGGFYYSNFDHVGSTGYGGNNKSGWVPEIGIGLGAEFLINRYATAQIGTSFVRVPEITEPYDENNYVAEDISLQNIFYSPISMSLNLNLP